MSYTHHADSMMNHIEMGVPALFRKVLFESDI